MSKDTNIKNLWTIVCKDSLLNADTENISLIDVIDSFSVEGEFEKLGGDDQAKLMVPVDMHFVSKFYKNSNVATNFRFKILFKDPNGEVLDTLLEDKIEIPKEQKRWGIRASIDSLPLTEKGEYRFELHFSEEDESGSWIKKIVPIEVDLDIEVVKLKKE